MSFSLRISLTAPFCLEDLLAECELADGTKAAIVLSAGQFVGELPAAPLHLRLVWEHPDSGPEALRGTSAAVPPPPAPSAMVAEAEELFERGIRIPEDGQLTAQLIWGIHCHQTSASPSHVELHNDRQRGTQQKKSATRFLSAEHVTCGQLVGKDAEGQRLTVAGVRAPFHSGTPLPLGNKQATFGQIVALAGDFYAFLDEEARAALPTAWPDPPLVVGYLATDYRQPTLCQDSLDNMNAILTVFKREEQQLAAGTKVGAISELIVDGVQTRFPVRRYLALASQNHCHFGAQPPDGSIDDTVNEALALYRYYHRRALTEAQAAGQVDAKAVVKEQRLLAALAVDAFGCHFLTDLFASGHLRVPRRQISERFGILRGALGMAHAMHDEDNRLGLWCTTRLRQTPRVVWRAFGDGMLTRSVAAPHLAMVREAVRRSAAEVFLRFCGSAPISEEQTAEALLPVALAAGTGPGPQDVLPEGLGPTPPGSPNHFPLYALVRTPDAPAGVLLARRLDVNNPQSNLYVEQDRKNPLRFPLPTAAP